MDTNILVYAAGLRRLDADEPKIVLAGALLNELTRAGLLRISAQTLAEFRHVLMRRSGLDGRSVTAKVAKYLALGECLQTNQHVLEQAFQLAAEHQLQTYDAIILAAAAQGGCEVLYSEDMQHGFEWNGVLVVNPFARTPVG